MRTYAVLTAGFRLAAVVSGTEAGPPLLPRNGMHVASLPANGAGSFKWMDAGSRQSKLDRKAAAQSCEALRSSSPQRLVLMAWQPCRWHRRR
jgi:hypothetical protein